jgi:hypothetical protein
LKKILTTAIVFGAALGAGSLALASTTSTESSGFTFSYNQESFTQDDWSTVSGIGYSALAECPVGQKYISAYVLDAGGSSSTGGYPGYILPDASSYFASAHYNSANDPDGVYVRTEVGQGSQGNGVIELICSN